ncbi:endoribonuclease LACTB2 [Atheta coriaria]|uniref:endoribonuclease LACTB2 n=1 Tax=Dalotia coriaria TaxID=877792 RepID=UPI0031F3B144
MVADNQVIVNGTFNDYSVYHSSTSSYKMATVIPSVTRISSRIIRVLGCNPGPMTLQGTNTYIIGTGKRRILLDTGDADVPQYINHLKGVLEHEKVDLAHIFISHWHHDHVGGLNDVLELESSKYCQVWKFPRKEDDASIKYDHLKDGQEFSVEGATLRVLHTPGHSTDHAVFQLIEDNAIFAGDCILGEGTAVFEDLHDYMHSLQAILDQNPAVIYPGHGNIINDPKERLQYYITHRNQREAQILNVLKAHTGKQFDELELVKEIYVDTPTTLYPAAALNVGHHLSKLLKEGKVSCAEATKRWQYKEHASKI